MSLHVCEADAKTRKEKKRKRNSEKNQRSKSGTSHRLRAQGMAS